MRMKKMFYFLFAILVLGVSALLLVKTYENVYNIKITKQKLAESTEKYEQLKKEKQKLQRELEEAREGLSKEKFARENLNLKKEGETIYKVDEEPVEGKGE